MTKEEYQRYLASRDWALLKERVRERCLGYCERCGVGPFEATHHLTYERIGHELIEDLMAICNECHEYVSGKSDYDPRADIAFLVVAVNRKRVPVSDWHAHLAVDRGRLMGKLPSAAGVEPLTANPYGEEWYLKMIDANSKAPESDCEELR